MAPCLEHLGLVLCEGGSSFQFRRLRYLLFTSGDLDWPAGPFRDALMLLVSGLMASSVCGSVWVPDGGTLAENGHVTQR
jgi:hypothetical protein